jgi:hypothetical protein
MFIFWHNRMCAGADEGSHIEMDKVQLSELCPITYILYTALPKQRKSSFPIGLQVPLTEAAAVEIRSQPRFDHLHDLFRESVPCQG